MAYGWRAVSLESLIVEGRSYDESLRLGRFPSVGVILKLKAV